MEIIYWWLISLPIFFGLGWMAARIDIREVLREAKALPKAFATSYRRLAEAKLDEALTPFQDFHVPSNASFDLLLSLGVLYRRQGLFIEAIHLHEQLHQRIDLSETDLDEVAWELAQDYLKAGMLDRSVMCIQALATPAMQSRAALTMLEIFQIQKQWDKALEYANKVSTTLNINEKRQCSHFHCELAIRAFQRLDNNAMEHHLTAALRDNENNVRVTILRGDFALAAKDYSAAIAHWKKVEYIDARFLLQLISKMHTAYTALDLADEEERLLTGYFENNPSAPLLDEVSRALASRLSPAKIFSWIAQFEKPLQSWQTFPIALSALASLSQEAKDNKSSELSAQIGHIQQLATLTRPQHFGYTCDHCGFLLQSYVWRCPGCGEWESFSPIPRVAA